MKKSPGYTIIELLSIIAILGIIVVVGLQVGESVTVRSRFTGMINNFLADFSAAKQLAAMENRYVAITFSADGRSYTLLKQTDISDYTAWTTVKKVTPFSDRAFFKPGELSDLAVNSTGEVRTLPIDTNETPCQLALEFFIRRSQGLETDPIAYRRIVKVFPYGGLRVEKQ